LTSFLDTNVLVYSIGADRRMPRAKELVLSAPSISVQVLNEFVNVARKKLRLSWTEVDEALSDFRDMLPSIVPLTVETHRFGVEISRKHGFHIYDSMIIASAALAGCDILYTEDMADGAVIAGVQIRNPFKLPAI
jgi:predicted nucleic acid-binding protein